MANLEEAIRNAVKRGEFVHLSVVPTGKNSYLAKFASASRAGGYAIGEGACPIQAMIAALEAAPMKRYVASPDCGKTTSSRVFEIDDPALG